MRRFITCFVAACAVAVLAVGTAPAKNGQGVMCVLHAKLAAKNETTGSTSTAKGHTLIKVRNDGTIEFKTQILNRDHETFVAGHIHQAPVGVAGAIVVPLFVSPTRPRARATSSRAASLPRTPEQPALQSAKTRAPTTSTTTQRRSRAARSAASSGSDHSREGRGGDGSPLSDARAARTAGNGLDLPEEGAPSGLAKRIGGRVGLWRPQGSLSPPWGTIGWLARLSHLAAQDSAERRIYLTRGKQKPGVERRVRLGGGSPLHRVTRRPDGDTGKESAATAHSHVGDPLPPRLRVPWPHGRG